MGHLLEEEEEHEIGDSCPENISECLQKHPLHLGPDHGHEEDHVDNGDGHEEDHVDDEEHGDDKSSAADLFIGGGVCKKLSL